jgi:hypothetical protein
LAEATEGVDAAAATVDAVTVDADVAVGVLAMMTRSGPQ